MISVVGTRKGKASPEGRVLIPRKMREERTFYVDSFEVGIDLYPFSNLSEEDLKRLADSRVLLDNQNRVNLSAYCNRYDIKGRNIFLMGMGNLIHIVTSEDYIEHKFEERSGDKNTFDEVGI